MYRLRKFLSIVLLFVMALSFIPEGVLLFDFEANAADDEPLGEAYPSTWGTFNWNIGNSNSGMISGKPGVYIMGDGYAIIWVTTVNGTGTVVFKDGNNIYAVHDERTGILRTNDTIHVVKLTPEQYACVQANGYYVVTRQVTSHQYAVTNYGTTITFGPTYVTPTPSTTLAEMNLTVLTDIHGNDADALTIAKKFANPHLYVFPGDLCDDYINEKTDLQYIFEAMGNITYGDIRYNSSTGRYEQAPTVYVRGNHECRGIASTMLLEYLPTKTGQFYFDFTYGPLWGVVIDTTEDKLPTHEYYGTSTSGSSGSVSNTDQYLIDQQRWLRSLSKSSSKFKLAIHHIPTLNDVAGGVNMANSIHHLGINLALAGHDHVAVPHLNNTTANHYTYKCGGEATNTGGTPFAQLNGVNNIFYPQSSYPANYNTYYGAFVGTYIKLTSSTAYVTSQFKNGAYFGRTFSNQNGANTSQVMKNYPISMSGRGSGYTSYQNSESGLQPTTVRETYFKTDGVNGTTYPSAGVTNSVVRIAVAPTVFETGGDWYNIVWVSDLNGYSTQNGNGHTKGVIGFVQYTYQGKTYQVFDEVAGFRRAYDNIHTVRVPKEHLSNNRYFVGNATVQYVNPTSGLYYRVGGNYTTSSEHLFMDRSSDKTPNILTFSDLKFPTNKFKGFVEEARDGLGTSASYVAVTGNAVQTTTGNRYPGMETGSTTRPEDPETTGLSRLTGIIYNDPLAENSINVGQSWNLHKTAYYNNLPSLFDACRHASHGEHPVIFSRGENECRGMFATELIRYLPTITGGFHYTVNIGDFTYVNMDVNEDDPTNAKADLNNQEVNKYDGRIDPDKLKRELDEYLTDIFGGAQRDGTKKNGTGLTDNGEEVKDKLVVISCRPIGYFDDKGGKFKDLFGDGLAAQWGRYLKQHGAIINLARPDLNIQNENSLFAVDTDVHERKMFTVRSGGYAHPNVGELDTGAGSATSTTVLHSVATSVLLSEKYAHIASCRAYGNKKYNNSNGQYIEVTQNSHQRVYTENTYSLVSGEVIKYTQEQPQQAADGTYLLSTPSHLAWLSANMSGSSSIAGKSFKLLNDIDLMLYPFTPIGGYLASGATDYVSTDYFTGTFDGNGYKIKNLHILPSNKYNSYKTTSESVEQEVGLFGAAKNATITGLTVEGGFIKGGKHTGALIGLADGSTAVNITNCYTDVTVFGPGINTTYGANNVGGFIGQITNNVKITQCANYGNVLCKTSIANVGGLVGSVFNDGTGTGKRTYIYNTYNRGHVVSASTGYIGGIIGRLSRRNIDIANCYNASAVVSTSALDQDNYNKIGALIGDISHSNSAHCLGCFNIRNCAFDPNYNGGNIETQRYTGQYAGYPMLRASGRLAIAVTGGTWYELQNSLNNTYVKNTETSMWAEDQPNIRNSLTKFNSGSYNAPANAYVADGSKTNGVNINDGYPIHAGLVIREPEQIISKNESKRDEEQDAFNKVNSSKVENVSDAYENNVNNEFSLNGSNILDLNQIPNGKYIYVLISNEAGTLYKNSTSTTFASLSNSNTFVWKLQKASSGSKFTLTNVGNGNSHASITLTKAGTSATDSNENNDTLTKDTLYTLSAGASGKVNILPILQDNDNGAAYGFSGVVNGGISSTISSLSVSTAHKEKHDHGLNDRLYDSVYGNNIFYYGNVPTGVSTTDTCFVIDMLSLEFRQTKAPWHLPETYMTAPDATGQLMDMACDNTTYAWEISPSNAADKALNYNSTNGLTFETDATGAAQKFFVVYSLNEDGGYYIIPTAAGAQTLSVDTTEVNVTVTNNSELKVSTHNLVTSSFNNSSRDRFWIQSNGVKIQAEVVDVLVRFDRDANILTNSGDSQNTITDFHDDIFEYVEIREETRFKNVLYQNSSFYNPNGFWTDIYGDVGGIEYVYAFDSIDVVSPTNIVCYRYFRPKVYHVIYQSNLPETPVAKDRFDSTITNVSASNSVEQIDVDTNDRPTRYYADNAEGMGSLGGFDTRDQISDFLDGFNSGNPYFTHDFDVVYNENGGTDVDDQTYSYTLNSWDYNGNEWTLTQTLKDKVGTTSPDHTEFVLTAKWSSEALPHNPTSKDKLQVFYGWNRSGWNLPGRNDNTVNNDNDFEEFVPGLSTASCDTAKYPVRKEQTCKAYWVGGDFSGLEDLRVWQDSGNNRTEYYVIAKLYDGTNEVSGYFAKLQSNASFAWDKVTTSNNVYATGTANGTTRTEQMATSSAPNAGQVKYYYKPQDADRGYAIRAQLKYSSNNVVDAYAFGALIAVNKLVDSTENKDADYLEEDYFTKYPVTVSKNTSVPAKGELTITVANLADKRVNGVTAPKLPANLTYKVYGVLVDGSKEYKILVVDNGVMVLEKDGGVSLDGIVFDKYEVVIENATSSAITLTTSNFKIDVQTNPYIYEVVINENGTNVATQGGKTNTTVADVEYVGNTNKFVRGERAEQGSTSKRFFYENDVIRVLLPTPDGYKLAAGSYITIENFKINDTVTNKSGKIFPTYSTTSTLDAVFGSSYESTKDFVGIKYVNGIDLLLGKTTNYELIKFDDTAMTINVFSKNIDNATHQEDNVDYYYNINVGPLGAKVSTLDTGDTKVIRFGTVWYLDDVVTENRWYRVHTDVELGDSADNGPTFGGYIIPLSNLIKYTANNDFYNWLNKGNDAKTDYLTEYNKTSTTTARKLELLGMFIAEWNEEAENEHINKKMSFGNVGNVATNRPMASDIGAYYYYYHPGDKNVINNPGPGTVDNTGVREAVVEYSSVFEIPTSQIDRELVYIPYASYVHNWNLGTLAPQPSHPDNIYIYNAPTQVYTYSGVNANYK